MFVVLGLVGKVDFSVRHLSSTTTNFPSNWAFSSGQQCIDGSHQVLLLFYYIFIYIFLLIGFLVDTKVNFSTVLCISINSFIRKDMDYAHHLSRICRCSSYHRWICTFHCMSILLNLSYFDMSSSNVRFLIRNTSLSVLINKFSGVLCFYSCTSISFAGFYIFLILIQIFGGVGIACLPLGLIFSFIRRPKAVITRSQYIKVQMIDLLLDLLVILVDCFC